MSISLTRRFDRYAPHLCVLVLVLSAIFPGRDLRTVRDLRAEFDAIKAENASLREDFASTLRFIREFDWTSCGGAVPDVDAPDGASASGPRVADGCAYTRCRGVDGVRRGNDTWLVGDTSPWGVIVSAFRGGFSTDDGSVYSYFSLVESNLLKHDEL